MMQVRAKDVRPGDVIDFGGQELTVLTVEPAMHKKTRLLFDRDSDNFSVLRIDNDALLNVERPDPDAELIEVMAKAICDTYAESVGDPGWLDPLPNGSFEHRAEYRYEARTALAAAREAGLL